MFTIHLSRIIAALYTKKRALPDTRMFCLSKVVMGLISKGIFQFNASKS